jgi:hypothetical protein
MIKKPQRPNGIMDYYIPYQNKFTIDGFFKDKIPNELMMKSKCGIALDKF